MQARAEKNAKSRVDAGDSTGPDDVGFYALYWFDWYWRKPLAGDWPALVVEPKDGRMPAMTPEARKTAAFMREHLHDGAETMEAGDRCVSRGVLGMMMPTAYNNGKLIVQTPGYVLIYSEMIHNARIIPLDGRPHVNGKVDQWEGDPRGHWEGEHARHRVDQIQGGRQPAIAERPRAAEPETADRRATDDRRREDAEILRDGRRSGDLHGAVDDRVSLQARRQLPPVRIRVPRSQLLGAEFAERGADPGSGQPNTKRCDQRYPPSASGYATTAAGVTLQERQRLLIELCDILIKRRVRAPLEDEELRIADAALQSIRETRRRQLIVAPECDLRRRGEFARGVLPRRERERHSTVG